MRIRSSVLYRACVGLGFTVLTALSATPVRAQFNLVTVRSSLGSTDFIDWGTLGGDGALVSDPFTSNSNGGVPLTLSKPGNAFVR